MNTDTPPGTVYLVGAGPGDPGLITVRGLQALAAADVIVYDHLAGSALLESARADAERVYVGKQAGAHALPQQDINRLLVETATRGETVVRLKGGDPYLFGRGGEEALALRAAGIPFEVISGVTAGSAAAAAAGIPITHRGIAAMVSFITGHEDPTKPDSDLNWEAIAQTGGTLVFYMGTANLPQIAALLQHYGRPGQTPAAVVHSGTLPAQQVVSGTLQDIAERVAAAGLRPPTLIVVGAVAGLREHLAAPDTRLLSGMRIVVTRARPQASDLAARLEALGARVLQLPTIEITPPESFEPLDRAIAALAACDWTVFTSVNGVQAFFDRMDTRGADARAFGNGRVCAIGPATAEALRRRGIRADLQPEAYVAESILEAFDKIDLAGKRVLLPRADIARRALSDGLTSRGARVDTLTVYRTVAARDSDPSLLRRIRDGGVDLITFTSSSTVKNFVTLLGEDDLAQALSRTTVACIGPVTAATARDFGLTPAVVAATYTIPGLVAAILRHRAVHTKKEYCA